MGSSAVVNGPLSMNLRWIMLELFLVSQMATAMAIGFVAPVIVDAFINENVKLLL